MSENVKMARQALDAYQSKPEFDSHGFAHHPLGDRDLGSSNAAVLYSGKYKKLYDENGVLRDTMRERIAIFDDGSLLAYKEYAGSKF